MFLGSCVPQKKLKYLLDEEPKAHYENAFIKDYHVQPGDNLYIQVLGNGYCKPLIFSAFSRGSLPAVSE
jgi:hypothetical protein